MPQQTHIAPAPATAQSHPLQALQQRRELLAEQYQTAMTERGHIGQERLNAEARGDASIVREYDGVAARIGARMQELERTIQSIDRQIDEVMRSPVQADALAPSTLGEAVSVTVQPPFEFFDAAGAQRVEYQRMMAAEGVVLLLLGAVLWRLGVARGRRQASRVAPARDETTLQQSIDAIAIEVERLSEGQRFITNVIGGRRAEREVLPVQPLPMAEGRDPGWITPH